MKILLDTNAYVKFQYGDHSVANLIKSASKILFSPIVAGELLHGFHSGGNLLLNRGLLDEFLSKPQVSFMAMTLDTGDRFGRLMKLLRTKGRPIPTNDVWIAAHAMESGAELVTFDRHFNEIDGLAVLRPA